MHKSPATGYSARQRSESIAIIVAVALTAFAFGWTLLTVNPHPVSRDASDHYGYLTDALLSGQLHLKLVPDPQLANLDNPYAGSQGVPRLHDATYFNGRYYLYFGPTPVLLLLGPWHLATRTYLCEGAATITFSFAGFLAGAFLWVRWKRRFLPALPAFWVGFAVLMLGLGNYVYFLAQTPMAYQVPISCAYACLMAALGFVIAATAADSVKTQAHGMALASLALGLAAGARPDYVLTLPALGLPLAALWWAERRRGGPGCRRLILCTLAPACAVGAVLAAYNWARFGSVTEFGVKYQLASTDQREMKLASLANLPGGAHDYLFHAPHYFSHFPFLSESADTFGILPWAPFALAALAFPLTLVGSARRERVWVFSGGFLVLISLLNFGSVCLVAFRNDRYAVDFLPAAIWLGLIVMAAALVAASRLLRLAGYVLSLVALYTLAHSLLLGLSQHPHTLLARALTAPVSAIERLAGVRYGPLRLEVKFSPAPVTGRSETLLSMADGADKLYVIQPDKDHVQFRFFHLGAGGPTSDAAAIDPTRIHDLNLDLGALYPPADNSAFSRWSPSLIDAVHRRLVVRLDDRTVLDRSVAFYPNDYYHTFVGAKGPNEAGEVGFTGTVLSARREAFPLPEDVARVSPAGPTRITLRFPEFRAIYGEPLISTGRSGEGDLVYVTYLGPGLVRFGHDCWNYGPAETTSVSFDAAKEQTVDVDMGSLTPGQPDLIEGKTRFQLRFNGRLIASANRPFHPSEPVDVVFGYNAIGASTASASFTGPTFRVSTSPPFPVPPSIVTGRGPVHLWVKFPLNKTGEREPLLVTGKKGAGDTVYVVYDDDSHASFGYDHAGKGAQGGTAVIDYGVTHELVIATGSLGSPSASAGDRVRLSCDGETVLDSSCASFPAASGDIAIGLNTIGDPVCGPKFSGIVSMSTQSPDP
jgi:hypothetical protein